MKLINLLCCFCFSSLLYAVEAPIENETFPVILEAYEHSQIVPLVYTRVVELPLKLGDSFAKGDLLIKFDNEIFKATLNKADKMVRKAKEEYAVRNAMHKDKLVSALDLLEAELNVATAENDYITAKKNLEESEIIAPFNGKISALNIHVFELPTRDKVIMEIFNDSKLLVNLLVPSSYLTKIKTGDPLYVYINDTGQIIATPIVRIGPSVNPASGTIKIEALLDNSSSTLKSGMASQAAFSKKAFMEKQENYNTILNEIRKHQTSGKP